MEPLHLKLQKAGRKTGLVSTATITHATPAGFAVNVSSRGEEDAIAAQYLERRVDVLLGGTSHNALLPTVRARLIGDVRSGVYDHVFMAPPCSTFSVALEPQLRDRDHPDGLPGLDAAATRTVDRHNALAAFAATMALVAHLRRVPFSIENPADRADDATRMRTGRSMLAAPRCGTRGTCACCALSPSRSA